MSRSQGLLNEQLSVRESERFRVHVELLLPIAKGKRWRACDGVETTSIPTLFENTQMLVSNDLYPCRYCTPVSSQCVARGGPLTLSSTCKENWTDAIIKMFPPVALEFLQVDYLPFTSRTVFNILSLLSWCHRRSLLFASSMLSPFRLARVVTFPIKPPSVVSSGPLASGSRP